MSELEEGMAVPGFWDDHESAEGVSRQFGSLKSDIDEWKRVKDEAETVSMLVEESEEAALSELEEALGKAEEKFKELEIQRLFTGNYDTSNAILSLHAGAGGVDAQDFTEMLLRMYLRFCESREWKTTMLSETRGTEAGIKSATFRVEGIRAYGYLKAEAGVHRLVRQSPFNADALRQTSFALLDVVPELEDTDIEINPEEIRTDTFMAGGHGGQGVNTTYSAVRLVHEPTGITVSCQNERSQVQNKETAMKILRGRLLQRKLEEREKELSGIRGVVESAKWGSQIRSYVLHPYKMVKDHRTNVETSDTDAVLDGDIMSFIEGYLRDISKA